MPFRPLLVGLLFSSTLAVAGEHAHEDSKAASPHEHGVADIRLVRDGAMLRVEIDLPMADALGHEQRPSTPEQRNALHSFQRSMVSPASVLNTTPACTAQSGEASAEGGDGEHRDMQLIYQLECPAGVLKTDFSPLFKKFPTLQQARLQWLSGPQADAHEINPAQAVAELPGS